eukprot:m.117242 g.117242  ORF g.117242 m.117242 type:complete len:473 (-) comp21683_c0_seq1:45-1463(-)
MHPRNRYADVRHDFDAMATAYPSLRPYVRTNKGAPWTPPVATPVAMIATEPRQPHPPHPPAAAAPPTQQRLRYKYDFSAAGATVAFTSVLLHRDFGIELALPAGQLAPPLPQRLNYIHWVEDVLLLSLLPTTAHPPPISPLASKGGAAEASGPESSHAVSKTVVRQNEEHTPDETALAEVTVDIGVGEASRAVAEVSTAPTAASSGAAAVDALYPPRQVRGIDVGTGCSCVYPLLATALHPDWMMVGTELSEIGVEYARKNVEANDRGDRIPILAVQSADSVLCGTVFPTMAGGSGVSLGLGGGGSAAAPAVSDGGGYDFCMCNPPFFDVGERAANRSGRRGGARVPGKAGSDAEMTTVGGEVGFVSRMIRDSIALQGAVRWYTSMLGKKASVTTLERMLAEHGVPTVLRATFEQGKTHRWALAWSWSPISTDDAASLPHGTVLIHGSASRPDHKRANAETLLGDEKRPRAD